MKNRNLPHSNNWATPSYILNPLMDRFNFNFDPCPLNHDIALWDGLKIDWMERNFINPPYSKDLKPLFIQKAIEESKKGKLCVLLLPVSTSTRLFHEKILPNITEPVHFYKGRIKFEGFDTKGIFTKTKSPMHDSMLIIMDGRLKNSNK